MLTSRPEAEISGPVRGLRKLVGGFFLFVFPEDTNCTSLKLQFYKRPDKQASGALTLRAVYAFRVVRQEWECTPGHAGRFPAGTGRFPHAGPRGRPNLLSTGEHLPTPTRGAGNDISPRRQCTGSEKSLGQRRQYSASAYPTHALGG